ncbi:hypothetical protein WJX75_005662 [Coccomyxa subellipsoidea]|uniref:EF-hand domain-containing protein n=1 Tax=Coccomyxa subellipsoidea TaxID=248742 RepID=A0ABR2YYC1_9CHLO
MNKLKDLEKDREERIKQNKARLAALEVGSIVDGLVSRETAAKQKAAEEEEHRKAQLRADEDDGEDADLQRALAMSLMEANAAHAAPSTSARDMTGPSYRGTEVPDQQETHAPAPAKPSGRGGRKAKRDGAAITGGEQQGKVKGSGKRRKGSALEARPQDIRKAFGMIAPCGKRISQELLAEVWEDMRGGKLDPAAANNMMTYAADVTGSQHLDFAAFQTLIAHFS